MAIQAEPPKIWTDSVGCLTWAANAFLPAPGGGTGSCQCGGEPDCIDRKVIANYVILVPKPYGLVIGLVLEYRCTRDNNQ